MIYAVSNHVRIRKNEKLSFPGGALRVSGAGGERCFGHFVVSADKSLSVKSVKAEAFRSNGAEAEIKAEIFWVWCVKVHKPSCNFGGTGEYPEVLVPVKTVAGTDKSIIAAGTNQSFLISFTIPRELKSGLYRSSVKLETNAGTFTLPLELEAFDFSLPKENHSASAFAIWYENTWLTGGDKDKGAEPYADSYDDYLKHYDLLKEYKIAATELPVRSAAHPKLCAASYRHTRQMEAQRGITLADLPNFMKAVKRYAADCEVPSYSLPYDVVLENGAAAVNKESLSALLSAMAEACTAELDLFAKAYFYVTYVDEPTNEMLPAVRKVTEDIREVILKTAASADFTGKENVKISLLSMDNVITAWPVEQIYGGVDTWCPEFHGWQGPEFRYGMKRMADLGSKTWWYGCIIPWHPYPSYHIDEPLLGARIEGLMRYRYGIKGNLYWAVNCYNTYDAKTNTYPKLDVYEDSMTCDSSNGEGVLVYEGSRFGTDAPLASMRLAAVCAGNQDYEYCLLLDGLIQRLNDDYKVRLDPAAYLRPVLDKIYNGVACFAGGYDFEAARRELAESITAAQKGILIEIGRADAKKQTAEVIVYYRNGDTVSADGAFIKTRKAGKGKADFYRVKLAAKNNYFCVSAKCADGSAVTVRRLVSPPVGFIAPARFKGNGNTGLSKERGGIRLRTGRFLNGSNNPSFSVTGKFDLRDLDSFVLRTDSLSADAFVLSVSITDADGRRFTAGYDIIEKGLNISRIHFNPNSQFKPGNEDACLELGARLTPVQIEKNKIALAKIVRITVEVQNPKVFCDLKPRELRFPCYDFCLTDFEITKWDGDNPYCGPLALTGGTE